MNPITTVFTAFVGLFFSCTALLFASDPEWKLPEVSSWEESFAYKIETAKYKPVEDKNAFLQMMADMSESNFKKMKTWTGEYLIDEFVFRDGDASSNSIPNLVDNGILPMLSARKTTITLSFSVDVLAEKKFLDYKEHGKAARGGASGNKNESAAPMHHISIVSPEHFINFQPNQQFSAFEQFSNLQQDVGRAAFVEERKNALPFQESVVTDPVDFYRIGPRFIWDELRAYVRFMEMEDQIQEQGTRLSVDVQQGINMPFMTRIVFVTDSSTNGKVIRTIYLDGSKQYNVVRFFDDIVEEIISPHVISDREYTAIDGIVIPSKISLTYPNPEIGKPDTFRRVCSLNHSSLNKPLGRDIFTVKNFNLSDGDRVFDKIAGTLKVMKGGELVDMRSVDEIHEPQRMSPIRVALIVVGILLIFAGLFGTWRKKIAARRQ